MATANELLPLDAVRRELRIPEGDTSQDALIEAQAEAALEEVQSRSGIALLDSAETIVNAVNPECGGAIYLRIRASSPRRVEGVRWLAGGVITPVDLTGEFEPRIDPVRVNRFGAGLFQLSRDGGGAWPDWPPGGASEVAVDLLSGVEASAAPRALVQAAVLILRQAYNGLSDPKADMAVGRIIAPFVAQG